MPLINLKTDLKSLKFGAGSAFDKPGGGFSNQPYITTPIPSDDSDPSTDFNTAGPDSLLRGGLTAPIKAITDVSRLTKMFFDTKSPNGLLFTLKQNILSRNSVKTEASIGVGTAGGTVNQGVYLPSSTILQAGVGFLGSHLNLLGVNPFAPMVGNDPSLLRQRFQGGLVKYESAAEFNNREDRNSSTQTEEVRVPNPNFKVQGVVFKDRRRKVKVTVPVSAGDMAYSNRLLNIWQNKQNYQSKKNRDKINILSYGGGPGSLAGIGRTHIKFAGSSRSQRTGMNNPAAIEPSGNFWRGETKITFNQYATHQAEDIRFRADDWTATDMYSAGSPNSPATPPLNLYSETQFNVYTDPNTSEFTWSTPTTRQYDNNSSTFNMLQIMKQEENYSVSVGMPRIQDFRKILKDDGSTNSRFLQTGPKYGALSESSLDRRVNQGSPGRAAAQGQHFLTSYFYNNASPSLDKINASGFFDGTSPTENPYRNDLVKLSIGILKNDGSGDSTYMHFRSFINSFSDNYTADWGDVQYVGRGDKFHNYKGFGRSISMGWTVYAQSKAELIPMYQKLNYLASSLAPDYSWGGYMRGNLARLTVGGYLYNQLGIIKSITYDIPSESTWEIGIDIDANFDHSVKELPHMIKVTGFTFTPIENKIPQIRNRFIHLAHGENSDHYGGTYPTKGTKPPPPPTEELTGTTQPTIVTTADSSIDQFATEITEKLEESNSQFAVAGSTATNASTEASLNKANGGAMKLAKGAIIPDAEADLFK